MGYPTTVKPEDGTVPSSISAVDPAFKMPQVWKTSLAIDYSFPTSFPFSITAEGIFNKTVNAVSISDWSMVNVGGFARFNGADNRPMYPAGAYRVSNTVDGKSRQISARVPLLSLPSRMCPPPKAPTTFRCTTPSM